VPEIGLTQEKEIPVQFNLFYKEWSNLHTK